MRVSNLWKGLTRGKKAEWRRWAKDNPVLLDHGVVRRVSGQKAFTVVQQQRVLAGEQVDGETLPAAETWIADAWDLTGSGPFTEGDGLLSLRVAKEIPFSTVWLVWATGPVAETHSNGVHREHVPAGDRKLGGAGAGRVLSRLPPGAQ